MVLLVKQFKIDEQLYSLRESQSRILRRSIKKIDEAFLNKKIINEKEKEELKLPLLIAEKNIGKLIVGQNYHVQFYYHKNQSFI